MISFISSLNKATFIVFHAESCPICGDSNVMTAETGIKGDHVNLKVYGGEREVDREKS